MSITVELPADVETSFSVRAKARGVSVNEFVRDYLIAHAPSLQSTELSAEELDAVLDGIADLVPTSHPPLSDEATSRESIYTREDEMR